jgi:hypothetical protein
MEAGIRLFGCVMFVGPHCVHRFPRYRLETLKPALRDVLTRLSIAFDPETPLANPASLLYAFTVTKLTPEKQDCVVLVRALEEKLKAFGPSVRDCFATIDKAFLALGFPE